MTAATEDLEIQFRGGPLFANSALFEEFAGTLEENSHQQHRGRKSLSDHYCQLLNTEEERYFREHSTQLVCWVQQSEG